MAKRLVLPADTVKGDAVLFRKTLTESGGIVEADHFRNLLDESIAAY